MAFRRAVIRTAPQAFTGCKRNAGAKNGHQRTPDVVINEIMYDPVSGDSDDEYVELHNRTTDFR